MPKKKQPKDNSHKNNPNVMGLRPEVLEQPITFTRSVIMSLLKIRL